MENIKSTKNATNAQKYIDKCNITTYNCNINTKQQDEETKMKRGETHVEGKRKGNRRYCKKSSKNGTAEYKDIDFRGRYFTGTGSDGKGSRRCEESSRNKEEKGSRIEIPGNVRNYYYNNDK